MFNLFDIDNNNDFKFILNSMGEDIPINNIPQKVVITNTNISADYNDKYISTLEEINKGDRIEYNDLYWLIISQVNGKRYNKYKGVMRACNHIIGFTINNKPVCVPVIIYGSTIGVTSNKYISVPENEIIVTMQKNEVTSDIAINDTFVKWGKLYTIDGIDLTEKGIIHLHCSMTQGTNDTEFICTEAGDINNTDWYITITGQTELEPDSSYSYTAKVYDSNGNLQDNLNVLWSLNDGANSTIDITGVLNTYSNGENIIIYATLDGTDIKGEFPVEVISADISYSITGASEIYSGYSETYTASKLINGTVDTSAVFNFSIEYQGNSSDIATLNVLSDTECEITANDATYYILLVAQDADTGESVSKEIKLKNLF